MDGWAVLKHQLSPDNAVVASGTNSSSLQLLVTTDGGNSWQEINVTSPAFLVFVDFTSATSGWALDVKGDLLTTSDSGVSWQKVSQPVNPTLALCVSNGVIWAANDGAVYKGLVGSSTWSLAYSNPVVQKINPNGLIEIVCNNTTVLVNFPFPAGASNYPEMPVISANDGQTWNVVADISPFYDGPALNPTNLTPQIPLAQEPSGWVVASSTVGEFRACVEICYPGYSSYVSFTKIDLIKDSQLVSDVINENGSDAIVLGATMRNDGVGMAVIDYFQGPGKDKTQVVTTTDMGSSWHVVSTLA